MLTFRFISHKQHVKFFLESLVRKSFLSRPFQLALDFTIVLYGEYLLASANLTLHLIWTPEWPSVPTLFTKVTA